MSSSHVEFRISSDEQFRQLCRVIDHLTIAKQSGEFRDMAYWLEFFDEKARMEFWWPTESERRAFSVRWAAIPYEQRWSDPSFEHPWDFASMIGAFEDGEYEFIGCLQVSETTARLEFQPHGWPYGGTECMEALISAFGHQVTIVDP
jgi:hypothetical protein